MAEVENELFISFWECLIVLTFLTFCGSIKVGNYAVLYCCVLEKRRENMNKKYENLVHVNPSGELTPVILVRVWRFAIIPYIDVTDAWTEYIEDVKRECREDPTRADRWFVLKMAIKDVGVVESEETLDKELFPLYAHYYDSALDEVFWADKDGRVYLLKQNLDE